MRLGTVVISCLSLRKTKVTTTYAPWIWSMQCSLQWSVAVHAEFSSLSWSKAMVTPDVPWLWSMHASGQAAITPCDSISAGTGKKECARLGLHNGVLAAVTGA